MLARGVTMRNVILASIPISAEHTYDEQRNIVAEEQPTRAKGRSGVYYLDGSVLLEPQKPTRTDWKFISIFVLIAIIISVFFLSWLYNDVINAAAQEQAYLEELLSQDENLNLPDLTSLLSLDDAAIEQLLVDQGYETYIISSSMIDDEDSIDIVKLPDGMTSDEGASLYATGISNLSLTSAVNLLYGSWRLDITRSSSTTVRVRYADFSSDSLETALASAMSSQGFAESSISSSGTDSAGNLYREGTLTTDVGTLTWRVSAISLSSVYNIDGLPSTSYYVGIRITL